MAICSVSETNRIGEQSNTDAEARRTLLLNTVQQHELKNMILHFVYTSQLIARHPRSTMHRRPVPACRSMQHPSAPPPSHFTERVKQ